jgi:predicted deacylase
LLAVPVVNVHGFIHHSRYLPDRRDLNRNFPGQARGSVTSRLASLVSHEIIDRADYGIDLHTGAIHRSNLPQIRGDTDNPEVLRLAKAFGAPVILHARLRDGSMREYAAENDIPVLVYEAGEALRLDEVSIRAGLRGVRRVLAELGMLRRPAGSGSRAVDTVVSRHSTWVRAPISGMVRLRVYSGASVRKGQRLDRQRPLRRGRGGSAFALQRRRHRPQHAASDPRGGGARPHCPVRGSSRGERRRRGVSA